MGRKRISEHLVNRVLKTELKDLNTTTTTTKGIIICTYIDNVFDSARPRSRRLLIDALKHTHTHFILHVNVHVTTHAPSGISLIPYLMNASKDSSAYFAAQELEEWLITQHNIRLRNLTTIGLRHAYKRPSNRVSKTSNALYFWNSEAQENALEKRGHSFACRIISKQVNEIGIDTNDPASIFLKQHEVNND